MDDDNQPVNLVIGDPIGFYPPDLARDASILSTTERDNGLLDW